MNYNSVSGRIISGLLKITKLLFTLSLFSFGGCDGQKYNVILATDSKDYVQSKTWDEIRENSFKKPYSIRVLEPDGHAVRLYRYNHENGNVMPLNETEIHFSTPIIIDKKYETISLVVLDHGKEVVNLRVVIKDLKPVKGGPKASFVPIELPLSKES